MAVKISIIVDQISQSVANNTSKVNVKVKCTWDSGSWDHYTTSSRYVKIDGTKYSFNSAKINPNNTTSGSNYLFDEDITIKHNSDGTKTLSCYASVATVTSSGTVTASKETKLTTIPRATTPTLSASSINLGDSLTISTPRASSGFIHKLTYTLNGTTGDIASNVGTSYPWSVPLDLASLIPNVSSATMKITCETFNGSTSIGTKTASLTVKVPDTVVPTINSITVSDDSGHITKYGGCVQDKTSPKLTIDATANHSNIASYKVGTSIYTSNVITLAPMTSTQTLGITATDSRGRTATHTVDVNVLEYFAPKVSAPVVRCNANGTVNDEGEHMKVSCAVSIARLNDVNANAIKLQYKTKAATDWTTYQEWSAYTVAEDVIIPADTSTSYDIRLVATDDFTNEENPPTYETSIGTVAVIMDFNASGEGIGIGKVSEQPGLEVDWEVQFNKNVGIGGNMTVDSDLTASSATINNGLTAANGEFSSGLKVGGLDIAKNKILWDCGSSPLWMTDTHTATLSENVSQQANGIVLCWSRYTDNAASNAYWNLVFIPKQMVALLNGNGYSMMLAGTPRAGHLIGSKYVYIFDDKITGYANNGTNYSGTDSGINITNKEFVLRYVIGV